MTDSADQSIVVSTLVMLACLVLGLLVGGMLAIGDSLIGFWRSLWLSDFQAWLWYRTELGTLAFLAALRALQHSLDGSERAVR
jgi:hypothetical protein